VHFSVNTMLTNVGIIAVVVLAVALLHIAPSAALQERVLAQPGWLQFLEVMTISEVCGYWAHRATHRVPLLWRFHRVHHSIEEMDWLAAARLHPVDQVFTRGCAILPLYALGFSRVAFGGLLVLLTFQALFIHANVRLDLGFLKHVVATPQFHHWHHTNEPGSVDHNFAGGLPLLDRLFGTLLLPPDNRFPAVYGTDDPLPSSWAGQMAAPFRRAA
jgi:sterol desaturase/sphingolipid hydroxylase (fatty acid hydroxylase superfamily)